MGRCACLAGLNGQLGFEAERLGERLQALFDLLTRQPRALSDKGETQMGFVVGQPGDDERRLRTTRQSLRQPDSEAPVGSPHQALLHRRIEGKRKRMALPAATGDLPI